MKVAVCTSIVIMVLASLMLFALFMNVFTPGSEADAQANVSSMASNASPGPSSLPIDAGMIETNNSGVKDDHLEVVEYGDDDRRALLEYIYIFTIRTPSAAPMIAPKLPLEVLWDMPFYESIKPIQDYDRSKLIVDDTSYRFDNGPLLIDPAGTYGGSVYAYPGDTIGIRLHIYNNGKLLSTVARVDIALQKLTDIEEISFSMIPE